MSGVNPDRLEMVGDMLDLDEFERIAVADIFEELEQFPPGPSAANEHLYMRLGAVVSDKITVWAEEPFGKGE